jgi:peptidyl-tRNA hydrolase
MGESAPDSRQELAVFLIVLLLFTPDMSDKLIQYIVIRRDLLTSKNWNFGTLIAQGAHASVAAVATTLTRPETVSYISDHLNMTKTVLGIDDGRQLTELSTTLKQAGILHHLWVEQPEDIPTALATAPDLKSNLAPSFKHLKLLK